MSDAVPITVSVTPKLAAFVDARVSSGAFASRSEVIRAGLRALRRAEPEDPWADGDTKDEGSGRTRRSEGQSARTGERDSTDDRWEAWPQLPRHRNVLLRLAEEYGLENLRMPKEEFRNAAYYPDILNLVVDFDVTVAPPVLNEVAARMGEVLGVFVWLEQERLSTPRPESDYVWIEEVPDGA